MEKRNGRIFGRCLGVIIGLLSHRATGGRINDFPQAVDFLKSLKELERGQSIVLMIGQRIRNRGLVSMVTSQVKSVVEVIGKATQDSVVSNRAADESDVGSDGDVGDFGRKQVIHDNDLRRIMVEEFDYQVGTNEPRSAYNEDFGVLKSIFVHNCRISVYYLLGSAK